MLKIVKISICFFAEVDDLLTVVATVLNLGCFFKFFNLFIFYHYYYYLGVGAGGVGRNSIYLFIFFYLFYLIILLFFCALVFGGVSPSYDIRKCSFLLSIFYLKKKKKI